MQVIIRNFLLVFFVLGLASCTIKSPCTPSLNSVSSKILRFNVEKIKIEGITAVNTYCEPTSNICPRDLLLDWIEHNVRISGNKGVLRIIINSATLQRSKVKRKMETYHGLYDVTLRLLSDEKWPDSYIELNVIAENSRTMYRGTSDQEKAVIIAEQINELVRLLEDEIITKVNIYFSDYLIK